MPLTTTELKDLGFTCPICYLNPRGSGAVLHEGIYCCYDCQIPLRFFKGMNGEKQCEALTKHHRIPYIKSPQPCRESPAKKICRRFGSVYLCQEHEAMNERYIKQGHYLYTEVIPENRDNQDN